MKLLLGKVICTRMKPVALSVLPLDFYCLSLSAFVGCQVGFLPQALASLITHIPSLTHQPFLFLSLNRVEDQRHGQRTNGARVARAQGEERVLLRSHPCLPL